MNEQRRSWLALAGISAAVAATGALAVWLTGRRSEHDGEFATELEWLLTDGASEIVATPELPPLELLRELPKFENPVAEAK